MGVFTGYESIRNGGSEFLRTQFWQRAGSRTLTQIYGSQVNRYKMPPRSLSYFNAAL